MLVGLSLLGPWSILLGHLDLVVPDTFNAFHNVVEFLFFLVVEATSLASFSLFQLLVLLDTLSSLSICFEQIKALLRHFVVNAVDFTSP